MTWEEWFVEVGLLKADGVRYELMFSNEIPDDLAKKLEIEPKEDT